MSNIDVSIEFDEAVADDETEAEAAEAEAEAGLAPAARILDAQAYCKSRRKLDARFPGGEPPPEEAGVTGGDVPIDNAAS